MEKHFNKPDWTEVNAMFDLSDYFRAVNTENDLNDLFDRELLKYKSEVNRDETPEFIDIQIEKITGMIEKVKTVKGHTKFNEYRNAIFYLKFLHIKQTEQPGIKPVTPEPIIEEHPVIKPEHSLRQIALIYVYEGKSITRANCQEIVAEHGYSSGEKLYQLFTYYSSTANRTGKEVTLKKTLNKIAQIEKIIPHLTESAQKKANDDVSTLKSKLEKEPY